MRHLKWSLLAALALAGCESTRLDRSCGGEPVELCGAREWAEITEATLTPEELPIADFSERAQIRVVLDRCDDAPADHEIELFALVPGDEDAGARLMSLVTLQEGEDGDTPGDSVIEVDVANPFIATVPARSDVTLRYVVRSTRPGGCTSGTFEQAYRTGDPREP